MKIKKEKGKEETKNDDLGVKERSGKQTRNLSPEMGLRRNVKKEEKEGLRERQ